MGIFFGTSKRKIRSAVRQELDRRERANRELPPSVPYNKARELPRESVENVQHVWEQPPVQVAGEDQQRLQIINETRVRLASAQQQSDREAIRQCVHDAVQRLRNVPGTPQNESIRSYCDSLAQACQSL